jgi:hypothetical protein
VSREKGSYEFATRPGSRRRGTDDPENGPISSGEWAYKPNYVLVWGPWTGYITPPKDT